MNIQYILIISFFIIAIFGTVFHFTHNWFKKGIILHLISAINESTWEHMKLLIVPTILVTIFQYITVYSQYNNFWFSILTLLIIETLSIPLIFEPLRIYFKKVSLLFTITLFYLSIIIGLIFQYSVLVYEISIISELLSMILVILYISIYWIFTYYPPKLFIFKDPVYKRYGDIR